MLTEEILSNWRGLPNGRAVEIRDLADAGYLSWAIKTSDEFGVAMPVTPNKEISEYFAGAHYYTGKIILNDEREQQVLMLTTSKTEVEEQFASLCAELLSPGENGELRHEIMNDPAIWWMQWKDLLGNKNVDMRVYDTLGELWTLAYLAKQGEQPEWNGPNGATYDIDCDGYFTEVKSTTSRNKRQITLSNLFQLDPPNGQKLFLVLCQFESALTGMSINSLVDDLETLGYSKVALNDKLGKLGLEKGKTARSKKYILHAATRYTVDEKFPAIRESSFIGGSLPEGVMSLTYTVTLDGITGENILKNGA